MKMKKLAQQSWIRALDSKFKICSKKLTNLRICYKALIPLFMAFSLACLSQILTAQSALFDDSDGSFTILVQAVTVLSPNGGENWEGGETHSITWSTVSSITNVNIDYSTNNGSSWTPVAANIANTGSYIWTVPVTLSTNCLVRVSDANNIGTYDDSNSVFSISAVATLAVISPNGCENWNSGSAQNITWTSTGYIANVSIDYSTNSGSSWTLVAANTANDGLYTWIVPATISTTCLVRISDATDSNPSDISNRIFSISSSDTETVTVPNLPTGPASGWAGYSYSFGSGCANSNFSDPLQYRFDWGDGTYSDWLATGTISAIHIWTVSGTYQVRAMARCALHTSVESPWSEAYSIIISTGIPGLQWNTFLGGSNSDKGFEICTDNSGNTYIIGKSAATWGTNPKRPYSGGDDVFVAKLDVNGVLLWHTFLGSGSADKGNGITVDSSGNIFVTGSSEYTWGSPLHSFSFSSNYYSDAFVAKLSSSGDLQWNTFLGGSGAEVGVDIALDASGNIFLTGSGADWGSNPLNPYGGGASDAFVVKLNAGGDLQWHTFMGGNNVIGTNADSGQKIALDNSGNIYVTGSSTATWGNPKNPFVDSSSDNYTDIFVAKLNAGGTREWNTFLGGSGNDYGTSIALNDSGNIYVSGNNFVAKLSDSGDREWLTSLGGMYRVADIVLDQSGYILVTGNSSVTWGNPLNPHSGGYDICVVKLNPNGSLQLHTFLGGIWDDNGSSITWDNSGNILVTGDSYSTWGNPLRPYSNNYDAFVAKLCFYANTLAVITPNGNEDWAAGSNHYITWSLISSINYVNIDYSTDSGNNWTPVAGNIPNTGAYKWTVPTTPSLTCLVRVSDTNNGATYDISDGVFFIAAVSVENVSAPSQPAGPNTCLINSGCSFNTGESTSSLGHVIQYKFDWGDGTDSGWLATGTTNAKHSWAVSGTFQLQAMARCATHTNVASPWSEMHTITIPAVNTSLLQWHTFMGGSNTDKGYSVITDNSGNIYIVGTSNASWGTNPKRPFSSSYDVFVVKLDPTGAFQWHTFLGGTKMDYGMDIAVDNGGNVYIAGFSESSWGSPINAYGGGGHDAFFAKLNADGVLQWHTFTGVPGYYNYGLGIASDSSSNIYVTGYSNGSWGDPINPYSSVNNEFLVKFDGSGTRQWNTFYNGQLEDYAKNGITIDSSGNIFVMGMNNSVIKFNGSGAKKWQNSWGGSGSSAFNLDLDNSGNIYIVGKSTASWGNPLNPFGGGSYDAFVAKLNASGIYQWHTFLGGSDEDIGTGITVNQSGDIYVSGYSKLTWGYPLNSAGGYYDGFVAKLNPYGIRQYHTFLGSSSLDQATGITLDNSGNIIVTGEAGATWGSPINSYSAGSDAFIAKFWYETGNFAIIAPNDGENWTIGSNRSITWSISDLIVNVNIDYSTDNGSNWTQVAASISNNGTFAWTVPATPSSNCLVRISDAANANTYDVSNAVFTISAAPTLTVITPNGGENWINGTAQNITWSSTGAIANVNIDYSTDNGSSWIPVVSNIANSGTYTWIVPTLLSANCLVRISDAANAGTSDVNDAVFTISAAPTLAVTAPNGGENWISSTAQNITWSSTVAIANVNIDYSTDSGYNWIPVAANIANSGTFSWNVPATPSSNCLVRISAVDNGAVFDVSDVEFTISVATSISVISPNGGEQWQRGTTQTITWTSSGVANIKIELLKGTTVNKTITTSTPAAAGSYTWAISSTQTAGTDYKIRITSTSSSTVTDSSNANFTIFIPAITVTAPAAGNAWIRGTSKNITWNAQGTVNANVKIQLFKGTTKTLDITTSTPTANGTFTWNIPSNLTTATNYAIKVITLDNQVTGTSGTFSIVTGIIIVTAPAAGTNWQRGVAHAITWTKEGTLNANVKIQLYKGTALDSTIVSTTPNNGSYNWTIPATKTLATNYKIRITTADNLVTSYSGVFSITNTSGLMLEKPNGSERLAAQTTVPIKWTVDTAIIEVKLEYSRDNGKNWTSAAANVVNSGSYTWKVPNTPSTTCLVRVSDAANAGTNDISNGVFAIVSGGKAAADFDNNGVSDMVWRYYGEGDNKGRNIICLLNADGTGKGKVSLPEMSDLNWKICGVGDFNNDGVLDILWRHYGLGINGIWLLNADNTIKSRQPLPALSDLNYQISGVGDFNNDGVLDILWRHYNSGINCIWLMNADHTINSWQALPEVIDTNWKICGVGDFNQDGVLDILWRQNGNGSNVIWLMSADYTVLSGQALPEMTDLNYKPGGVGDFNGDGVLDIVWRHQETVKSGLGLMNPDYSLSSLRPLPGFLSVNMADFNWQITNSNNNDTIVSSTLTAANSLEIEQMTETLKQNAGDAASSQLATATLQIISPSGGENWSAGTMHDISWNVSGSIANVNIDYSTDNGKSWALVAVNLVNSGTYVWAVPETISANCLLRVSDSTNSGIVDVSDRIFSISSSASETISTPSRPAGLDMGLTNTGYNFTAGNASSNFGDAMQYKFDWGDGTDSGWLAAGTVSAAHTWTSSGIYHVRAMARAKKTGVESSWSTAHDIIMANSPNDLKADSK